MISDEDYEFLKDLQHKLNTQETDCQADLSQHIEGNKHHYDRPRTYANTAYRNYELERLLKILKTMDLKEHNSKPSHVEESSVYDGPEGVWDNR